MSHDPEIQCFVKATKKGYRWKVRWPNGGSVSGAAISYSAAIAVVADELRRSVYGQALRDHVARGRSADRR